MHFHYKSCTIRYTISVGKVLAMFTKTFYRLIISAIIIAGFAKPVYAVNAPTFPSCANAQGTIKASYPSGVHGIPGKSEEFKGSDNVYLVTEDTVLQCFCPESGQEGIQTNWWKIASLKQDEIDSFVNKGWIFVPDGSLWGLDQAPYLAQNIQFSCKAGETSGGGVGGGFMVGEVLGLASTGNMLTIIELGLTGLTSIILGILLRKRFSK